MATRWLTRPKLSVCQETLEVCIVPWLHIANEAWIATRIKVKNDGSTAAEDCKAYLITDKDEYRIG
ncbi:MAG: hypothetical protein DLM72_04545 [Candidatus Nitrosopolaris wilkensis]|nr:MAG: hypothetical protein DLM72_04545 [Candidatus Nitrosopolaris wilkensis]